MNQRNVRYRESSLKSAESKVKGAEKDLTNDHNDAILLISVFAFMSGRK